MPTSSSSNYGFPLPGAASGDLRLADMQAVKSALVALDADMANKSPLSLLQNIQTSNYSLVLSDSGKQIFKPSAATDATFFIIPSNADVAFPIGTAITFINQDGAGDVTISIVDDIMRLTGLGTQGDRTLLANGVATVIKITATEWIISGSNLS